MKPCKMFHSIVEWNNLPGIIKFLCIHAASKLRNLLIQGKFDYFMDIILQPIREKQILMLSWCEGQEKIAQTYKLKWKNIKINQIYPIIFCWTKYSILSFIRLVKCKNLYGYCEIYINYWWVPSYFNLPAVVRLIVIPLALQHMLFILYFVFSQEYLRKNFYLQFVHITVQTLVMFLYTCLGWSEMHELQKEKEVSFPTHWTIN